MPELLVELNTLTRPRLLINAARLGMSDYRRETHLTRHLGPNVPRRTEDVLRQLMALESDLDQARQIRAASYSIARHVGIMIAMMHEARLLCLQSDAPARELTLSLHRVKTRPERRQAP